MYDFYSSWKKYHSKMATIPLEIFTFTLKGIPEYFNVKSDNTLSTKHDQCKYGQKSGCKLAVNGGFRHGGDLLGHVLMEYACQCWMLIDTSEPVKQVWMVATVFWGVSPNFDGFSVHCKASDNQNGIIVISGSWNTDKRCQRLANSRDGGVQLRSEAWILAALRISPSITQIMNRTHAHSFEDVHHR